MDSRANSLCILVLACTLPAVIVLTNTNSYIQGLASCVVGAYLTFTVYFIYLAKKDAWYWYVLLSTRDSEEFARLVRARREYMFNTLRPGGNIPESLYQSMAQSLMLYFLHHLTADPAQNNVPVIDDIYDLQNACFGHVLFSIAASHTADMLVMALDDSY